jgi:predicted MFS family arabinose efflux permease
VSSPPSSSERRIVLLVALVQLVNVLDFMMVMPLGPDFAGALGIPESRLGLIGGSYVFAAAIAGVVSSRFLDRFDRRSALAVSMAGLALGTLAGGLAVDFETLVAARVLAGAFGGPATAVSYAIIADTVPPERRGRAMGLVSAAFAVCSVLGVPAGLRLARLGTWQTPFFAVAALGVVITLVSFVMLPRLRGHLGGPATRTTVREILARPDFVFALVCGGCLTFSLFLVIPNLSAYLQHNLGYPRAHLEYLYFGGGIASFTCLFIAGRAVDRIGATAVTVFGTLVFFAATVLGLWPQAPLLPLVATFILYMCSGGLRSMPVNALVSRLPSPHERAQFMALQSSVMHVSSALGAFVAAQLLGQGRGGTLLHMPRVLAASMAAGVLVPVLLWQVELRVRARDLPQAAGDAGAAAA